MLSNTWTIIINSPRDFSDKYNIELDSYCYSLLKDNLDLSFISCILHDSDKKDNGDFKTLHIHVIIVFNFRISKVKLLDKISDVLKFDKELISIDNVYNLNSSIRYLIHKDNPNKFQYFEGNILTNNIERVTSILENPNFDFLDYSTLYAICRNSPRASDIMSLIGLQNYKKYRSCIKDILEELRF